MAIQFKRSPNLAVLAFILTLSLCAGCSLSTDVQRAELVSLVVGPFLVGGSFAGLMVSLALLVAGEWVGSLVRVAINKEPSREPARRGVVEQNYI